MNMLRSPLISAALPSATPGSHKSIGYAYVRSLPLRPHVLPSPTFTETGEPVLKVEQVGYCLFYPCQPARKKGWANWFPEPIKEMTAGYERFLGRQGFSWLFKALRYVIGRLQFPAYTNALLDPITSRYPVAIFSHGLAGTRHTYTQYASALASTGYLVLLIEHRDGSGPAVTLPAGDDGKERILPYVKHAELSWKEGEDSSLERLRTLQLETRVREVYEGYHAFKRLVADPGDSASVSSLESASRPAWMESFKDKVNFDEVYLTGHSFGACTALHLLQSSPPEGFTPLPVKRAVALDPWLDPIPKPSSKVAPPTTCPPLLVINSPGFTVWDSHFRRLLGIVKRANADLVTLIGANHQSFSDFPLLSPGSPSGALDLLTKIHDLSFSFLRGDFAECVLVKGKKPDGGDYAKGKGGKMAGKTGEVAVHCTSH